MAGSSPPVPDDGGKPNFYSQGAPDEAYFQQQPPYGVPQQQAYGIPEQQQQQPDYGGIGMPPQQRSYGMPQQPYYGVQQQPAPYGQPPQQLQAQVPPYYYQPQAVGSQFPPPPPPNAPFARPGIQSPQILPPQQQQYWTSGIFDCFQDMQSCIITTFVPCVTYGQVAEILDQGTTSCAHSGVMYFLILWCFAVPCFYSYTARSKLRYKYSLPEDPMSDLCTHCFCEPFALCQEYRELKNRGIDPALGWTGYQMKQNQEMMMAAPTAPAMAR